MNKEKNKIPFISEVEEFNEVMGKSWQNRTSPTIDPKDAQFVIDFITEELDELKEAVKDKNIIEIFDALLDITYVEETVKIRSEQQGEPCHYLSDGNGKYVVYRSSDNKIMKSMNYFRPDLAQFFTEDEINGTYLKS